MDLLKAYIQVRYLGLGLNNREKRGSYKIIGFIEMGGKSLIFLVNI